jgi:hypothetical protein
MKDEVGRACKEIVARNLSGLIAELLKCRELNFAQRLVSVQFINAQIFVEI